MSSSKPNEQSNQKTPLEKPLEQGGQSQTTAIPDETPTRIIRFKRPEPFRMGSLKNRKFISLSLLLIMIILGGITIVTAWRLRQVEKVTPEPGRAATAPHAFTSADWTFFAGVLKTPHSNYGLTVGPGPLDFVASGFGMRNHTSGNIHLEIPSGASIEKVFAFWAGNRSVSRYHNCVRALKQTLPFCECRMQNMATQLNTNAHYAQVGIGTSASRALIYPDKWLIGVHDEQPQCHFIKGCCSVEYETDCDKGCCPACETTCNDIDCPAYGGYFADITNEIKGRFPAGTSIFNISVGDMYFQSENSTVSGNAGMGVGIILIYRQESLPESKIIIKHWGQFILRSRTDKMTFSVSDIDTAVSNEIKAVFFFNEAEGYTPGQGAYTYRPNYLYYNGQVLNPGAGTGRYVAYSVENPYDSASTNNDVKWWDTRISGVNLDPIIYQGVPLEFELWSPNTGQGPDPSYMGDSVGIVGGAVKYATGPGITPTPTSTNTPTPTPTPTATPTPKPTNTPTPRPTPTSTPTPTPTVTPTPTPTPPTLCLDLTSTAEGSVLQQGQEVTFTCIGSSGIDNPIDHVEFQVQINDGSWVSIGIDVASRMPDGTYQGSVNYTVPSTGVYRFECRVCTTSYCTTWGKAQ